MAVQWILFESQKIYHDASYKAFKGDPKSHTLVDIGRRILEVPNKDFIELTENACLISHTFLRKRWFGEGLIKKYGRPADGLQGGELEAHAHAWLYRAETAKIVIHATITSKTKLSHYLDQNGTGAILPQELVVQHGALFEVPAWTADEFCLLPATTEDLLLYGEWRDLHGWFVVVNDIDHVPDADALLQAGDLAIIGMSLADAMSGVSGQTQLA